MKNSEKTLFLSLWAIVLLLILLWRFWPHQIQEAAHVGPPVSFGKEISGWFSTGTVVSWGPNQFTVDLELNPDFLEKLNLEGRQFHIEYHYLVETGELANGVVLCHVNREKPVVQLLLPNPKHVAARAIELTLAH